MITLTTATGKQFESDFAAASETAEFGFFRIVNSDFSTVCSVFANPSELPFVSYPKFNQMWSIAQDDGAIQLVTKHREEETGNGT